MLRPLKVAASAFLDGVSGVTLPGTDHLPAILRKQHPKLPLFVHALFASPVATEVAEFLLFFLELFLTNNTTLRHDSLIRWLRKAENRILVIENEFADAAGVDHNINLIMILLDLARSVQEPANVSFTGLHAAGYVVGVGWVGELGWRYLTP